MPPTDLPSQVALLTATVDALTQANVTMDARVSKLEGAHNSLVDFVQGAKADFPALVTGAESEFETLKSRFESIVARYFPSHFGNHPAATPQVKPAPEPAA